VYSKECLLFDFCLFFINKKKIIFCTLQRHLIQILKILFLASKKSRKVIAFDKLFVQLPFEGPLSHRLTVNKTIGSSTTAQVVGVAICSFTVSTNCPFPKRDILKTGDYFLLFLIVRNLIDLSMYVMHRC
jgi:hypothetical protein